MGNCDHLEQIRPQWLDRALQRLAPGEGIRQSFLEELNRFYDLLEQDVETGDPAWMNSILIEWVASGTQSEVDKPQANLLPVLTKLLEISFEVSRDSGNGPEALTLVGAILPVFTYAFEYASSQEAQFYVNHISRELEKANTALESLDKSKSDFIAVAAHELKTPLTLIEGYTSMLRELLPEDVRTSIANAYLKGIDTGSHRLKEIVDDMIDVSMIDNRLLSISFQPFWLNRILSLATRELVASVEARKQKLVIRAFDGSEEMSYGDGERLLQAFRNIISNAIKYTPDGGTITIDGRLLPGFVEVTISDTGIGIAPEDYHRIFDKFGKLGNVSLHSSSKTNFKGGGPGLGLSITKGIIEAHGGAIWVESEGYDETRCPGSTFHILLPLISEPSGDKTTKLFQARSAGKARGN
ncbi:MAG: sensor histidine kinase [Chloroflexota bacterium]|nr:MAG: sensor histidine kinase [Chloroflexota bacterium]